MADAALRPATKSARHQLIIDLVAHREVHSQTELRELLADAGIEVTQATLSRDLVELDAVKVRAPGGALVYAVPAEGGDRRQFDIDDPKTYSARLSQDAGPLRLGAFVYAGREEHDETANDILYLGPDATLDLRVNVAAVATQ